MLRIPRILARIAIAASVAGVLAACGSSLPQPKIAPQPKGLYYEVSYPPPPAHVQTITPRPDPRAVWIDGEWSWQGSRWVWQAGGWTDPPAGAVKYAKWDVRRTPEGRLIFAPGTWLSATDSPIPPRAPAAAQACEQGETAKAPMRSADEGEATR